MTEARRQAELVLEFSEPDANKLRSQRHAAVEVTTNKFGEFFMVISSKEMSGEAAETHLERLWERCEPFFELIDRLGTYPKVCVLRVVQYVSSDDDIGPGVPVDEKWVSKVAQLGGSFDIDMYVS